MMGKGWAEAVGTQSDGGFLAMAVCSEKACNLPSNDSGQPRGCLNLVALVVFAIASSPVREYPSLGNPWAFSIVSGNSQITQTVQFGTRNS